MPRTEGEIRAAYVIGVGAWLAAAALRSPYAVRPIYSLLSPLTASLAILIFPPLEELMFRRDLFDAVSTLPIRQDAKLPLAALLSCLLFSLAHGPSGPLPFLQYAVQGMVYSLVYARFGLKWAILTHAAHNAAILSPALLGII